MFGDTTALIVLVIVAVYLLAAYTVTLAIRRSRTPQGATAWSIAIISLPLLVLPLYWVFGRSKFHGYVESHRAGNEELKEEAKHILADIAKPAAAPAEGLAPLYQLVRELTNLPFLVGNTVDLLVDGEQTFASMLEAIRGAKEYVLVQCYIYRDDGIGKRVKDALLERVEAGVRVYFLYDEIGSSTMSQSFKTELIDHGVEVSGFKTTKGRGNRFQINFRNHRKLLIVDGDCVFVGGLNVGDDYLGLYPSVGPWRDTHVKIAGPAVQAAQVSFVKDWYWAAEEILPLNWQPKLSNGESVVAVVHTGPADLATLATLYHVAAFNSAQERIWIANPYFVPDEPTAKALELAALRGVDVRIILPANNDNRLIQLAAMTYVAQLQHSGVQFFLYMSGEKGFLHQKTFLVDDRLSAIGTTNLDNRSLHVNFECSALIVDEEFAQRVEEMLLSDFKRSSPIENPVFEGKSRWHVLAAKAANLGAPML